MLAIRLEKWIESRLARIALAKGVNKISLVREAVVRYIEDQEDVDLAQRAHNAGGKPHTITELRKKLALNPKVSTRESARRCSSNKRVDK